MTVKVRFKLVYSELNEGNFKIKHKIPAVLLLLYDRIESCESYGQVNISIVS